MSMTAVPVMTLVRVQVPDGIDPGLVEAEVTRSICLQDETPMSAEVIALPPAGPTAPSARAVTSLSRCCPPPKTPKRTCWPA